VADRKVSMNVTDEDLTVMQRLADQRGVTRTEAVRNAVATEDFLRSELKKGSQILIKDPDGTIRQLLIR